MSTITRTYLKVEQHDTQADLFDALCRVFVMQENNGTRWVSFKAEGVSFTFFGPDKAQEAAA